MSVLSETERNNLRQQLAAERTVAAQHPAAWLQSTRRIEDLEAQLGMTRPRPPKEVPEIPMELFIQIGKHLKPGSRTLLNLASANHDLFALLLPRLLEALDSNTILSSRFAVYRRDKIELVGKYTKELYLPETASASGDPEPCSSPRGRKGFRCLQAPCAQTADEFEDF